MLTRFALPMIALAVSMPLRAQSPDSTRPKPLFTSRDAVVAGGFVAATILAFPLDKRIAHSLENQSTQANKFFGHAATGFEVIASPGAYVIGGGLYAVGRLAHIDKAADLGLHGTEAVIFGDAITGALKGLVGRSRPYVSADSNPHDFGFGKGFTHGDRTSFPSGHTTSAFAAAAAVTAETGRWWPGSTKFIGPVMYGGATMVGLSRMYHNKHWASDVALGAAIGTFSGQKLDQYVHARPHNVLDRVLLHTSLAPDAHGGAALGWSAVLP